MSEVYFVPVESKELESRSEALEKLLTAAMPSFGYKKDELVPIKLTIGDADCVYHINPEFVRRIISRIRNQKAKPFLFDTSVIYKGSRQNAADHLGLVQSKGFNQIQVGAPFLIADGLLGQDGREIAVNSKNIKKIKVPSFVGYVDSLVVLSHATGHILSGFAAAVKNVAMGMSCRATKQVQHSSMKPSIIREKCTACGCCIRICPVCAIAFNKRGKAQIAPKICIGCGECLCACKFDAVDVNWKEDVDIFCRRMADVAQAILSKFKNKFFITFAFDIMQECDCISTKNDQIVSRNIGILASEDPVSLDQATSDLLRDEQHYFKQHNAYKKMFAYAHKIGLGALDYRLIKV
jgi:uncharacterized Fe-S center protein